MIDLATRIRCDVVGCENFIDFETEIEENLSARAREDAWKLAGWIECRDGLDICPHHGKGSKVLQKKGRPRV